MDVPLLQAHFSPLLGVIPDPSINALLPSPIPTLSALLAPFAADLTKIPLRTSQLETHSAAHFSLRVREVEELGSEDEALADVVQRLGEGAELGGPGTPEEVDLRRRESRERVNVPHSLPWYDAFATRLLEHRTLNHYSTFEHPLTFILATSTASPDPVASLTALASRANLPAPYASRQYMDASPASVLRYFVLVHDAQSGPVDQARLLLEQVKKAHGVHCALIVLNSPSTPSPEAIELFPPSEDCAPAPALSEDDLTELRAFVRELVVQSLLPWMERCVGQWNEQLAASRKGITNRLFGGLGRRYFGGGSSSPSPARPASPGPQGSTSWNPVKGFYPSAAPEALARRLADFAFILRDYRLAASTYDQLRRDTAQERGAWRYVASATEMLGLSHLLSLASPSSAIASTGAFLEQACATWLAYAPTPEPAEVLRATVLYFEAWKARGVVLGVPAALVCGAGQSVDVSAAILLEQAALAYLRLPRQSLRKAAFFLVQAGVRYELGAKDALALRAFRQASSAYVNDSDSDSGNAVQWSRSRALVEHALGRLAEDRVEAALRLTGLLRPPVDGEAQGALVEEWQSAIETLAAAEPTIRTDPPPEFALPCKLIDLRATSIRITAHTSSGSSISAESSSAWGALEERCLQAGFAPEEGRKRPLALGEKRGEIVAEVGEIFYVGLRARNPLNASIVLANLTVEVVETERVGAEAEGEKGKGVEGVEVDVVPEVHLGPLEDVPISLSIRSSRAVRLTLTHASFKFHDLLHVREPLARKGRRLQSTKAQRLTPTYARDTSLDVLVAPPRPAIDVRLEDALPASVGLGEGVVRRVEVRNVGRVGVRDLRVLVAEEGFASFGGLEDVEDATALYAPTASTSTHSVAAPNDLRPPAPTPLILPGDGGVLAPGQSIHVPVLLRGDRLGAHSLHFFFIFQQEGVEEKYHVFRTAHELEVIPVVDVRLSARASSRKTGSYLLSLEVESLHLPHEVQIVQVSTISPLWTLRPLGGSPLRQLQSVPFQQVARTLFSLESQSTDADGVEPIRDLSFTVDKLRRLLNGQNIRGSVPDQAALTLSSLSNTSNTTDLSLSAHLHPLLSVRRVIRCSSLASIFSSIPASDAPHIFTLFEPSDVDVLVLWSIPAENRFGHAHISGMSLGARAAVWGQGGTGGEGEKAGVGTRALFEETAREKKAVLDQVLRSRLALEEDPIVLEPRVDAEVEHDFSEGPITLSVPLALRNLSLSHPADYVLELLTDDPPSPRLVSDPLPPPWTGPLTFRGTVPATGEVHLHPTVWVSRPGTYSIDQWVLGVETMGGRRFVRRGGEGQTRGAIWVRDARGRKEAEGEEDADA